MLGCAAATAEGGHATPADGAECMVCFDDIDMSLYCEYKCCDTGACPQALMR